MTNLANVVLDDQGHVRGHGERHLAGQARRLREHVQVPGEIPNYSKITKLLKKTRFCYLHKAEKANIKKENHNVRSPTVPAGKSEGDGLLHLNDDCLLFLVHVRGLGELDVAGPDIAGGRELDALLSAADHHRLAELREIPVQNTLEEESF